MLNDDVIAESEFSLRALVEQALRPEAGAVGGLLRYPSRLIQHAGIAIGIHDGVGHPGRGTVAGKYWGWLETPREVSAVTGACLATRRSVFEQAGGWDSGFPENYNDVDYCLRVRELGYAVIQEPRARFRHEESATRRAVVRQWEQYRFFERHFDALAKGDRFYNPNLSPLDEQGGLRDSGDSWPVSRPVPGESQGKDRIRVEG